MDRYTCPQTTGTRLCVESKISPAWNIVNVIVKSIGDRYQLDWDAFRLRYGLCLGIQRDQQLHALSGNVLAVQFSKSTLELQLSTLDIMEVAYRPKPKHESFKKYFQKRNLPVVTKIPVWALLAYQQIGLFYFAQDVQDAQDAQVAHWMRQCARYAQDLRKILSPNAQYMRKICARFYLFHQCAMCVQDFTSFPNAQNMRKICARLYFFPQCAIYAQDCTYFSNAQYMRKIVLIFSNAQYMCKICARLHLTDLRKIVLISPMRNIRMCKICTRLYLTSNLKC